MLRTTSSFIALLFVSSLSGVLQPAAVRAACPGTTGMNAAACSSFTTYADPWAPARERWWDISTHAERQFDAFLDLDGSQPWSYANDPQVTITYDSSPSAPYFIGHIQARRLKPNFAYQLKLMGKPVKGSRGFGANGDDLANERLGYAGRWWCDSAHSTQTNFDDSHYVNFYKNAPGNGNPVHNIYGYMYLGVFVTNALGNADISFTGQNSYHITWGDWQVGTSSGMPEDPHSPFSIQGGILNSNPTTYYGYGSAAPTTTTRLFYEYEGSGRPRNNVVLPAGTYDCRFLLTEETFHNSATNGGYWKSVLTADNINFRIGAPGAPSNLSATGGNSRVVLSWNAGSGATSYNVKRGSSSTGSFTNIATGVLGTGFTDTSVINGTRYYYVVTSQNDAGESVASNVASAMPIDTTRPTLTITNPGSTTLSRLDTVAITATDDVGVTRVEFSLQRLSDGKYWNGTGFVSQATALSTAPTGTNTFARSGNLPGSAEGRYAIYAYAFDARGNSGFSRKIVSVNLVPPTVQIISHSSKQIVTRLDAVNARITDNVNGSGINPSRVLLYIQRSNDGKWWTGSSWSSLSTGLPMTPDGTDTYARTTGMPGSLGESGRYLLMVYAYDNVGLMGRSAIPIATPMIAPTISILSPASASTLRVNQLGTVQGIAYDNEGGSGLNRVVFYLQRFSDSRWWDGDSWETSASTLTTNLTSGNGWQNAGGLPSGAAMLPNGRYLIIAYAYDNVRQANRAISVFNVSAP